MSIRKVHFQLNFIHILTFQEEYKKAVSPFFKFENMAYAIDNENTLHESIRLVFKTEQMVLVLGKEAIAIAYEGPVDELKKNNGVMKIFWDLYEIVKRFSGYNGTSEELLITHAVEIKKTEEIDSFLLENEYVKNPFGKLEEFASIFEFTKDNLECKVQFGNFSKRDIKIHDLTPFNTEFNKDLIEGVGIMARAEIKRKEKNPTFSKFKNMMEESENIFKSFKLV